jgi:5-methylcytosine-specific restriction protein A
MAVLKKISDTLKGIPGTRSPKWAAVRKQFLQENPVCALCGGAALLEVHHKLPFHLHPELELEPSNLITLCESSKGGVTCHLFFGHLGDYKSFNKNVDKDVKSWNSKLAKKPVSKDDSI